MNYFQLLYRFNNIYDSLLGREVDKKIILRKFRNAIPFQECKLLGVETMSLPYGKFNVSGLYDPDQDEQGKPPITIEIAFPKLKKKFTVNDSNLRREHWAELCIDLASVLGHEFMHLQQFRSRNFSWPRLYRSNNLNPSLREVEEYYGDPDEIGAYAFMAASEYCINKFSNSDQDSWLQDTHVHKTYNKFFTQDHPVMIKFVKLSHQYAKKLEKQYHATTFQ